MRRAKRGAARGERRSRTGRVRHGKRVLPCARTEPRTARLPSSRRAPGARPTRALREKRCSGRGRASRGIPGGARWVSGAGHRSRTVKRASPKAHLDRDRCGGGQSAHTGDRDRAGPARSRGRRCDSRRPAGRGGTCLPAGEDEDGARPCSRTAPTRVPRSRSGRHGRPGGRVRPRGGSPRGRGRHRVRSPRASGPPGGPGCSPARRAGTGPRCGGVPWPGRGAWRGPIPPPVARWRPCPGTRT